MNHTCVLTISGGVKCWGSNYFGQLGNGTNQDSKNPVDVKGLTGGVKAISVGSSFACALLTDGTVKCWGANQAGQLGNGTETDSNIPVAVQGISTEVTAVVTGKAAHVCALLRDGKLACWGLNEYGQLGNGTSENSSIPAIVEGVSNVAVVAPGYNHTCVLGKDRIGRCWGQNAYGQLGDGTTTNAMNPVKTADLPDDTISMFSGGTHTCILTSGGEAFCWGWNEWGQLGFGTVDNRSTPVPVQISGMKITALSAGGYFTCARIEGGGVRCWGGNDFGQLGDGSTENSRNPVEVLNLTGK